MTKYSDFVKRYMKENGKNWNCAVCDIKKGDLYNDFKKGENKQIKSDMEMMGAEDRDAPAPAKKIIIKKKRLRIVGQKKVKTLEPSPIPPPMALEPADPNTRTNMALGSMPELLGAMIQDFARPTEDTIIRRRKEKLLEDHDRDSRIRKLRREFSYLNDEKYTNKVRLRMQQIDDELEPLVKPILKKELESGYFTQGEYRYDAYAVQRKIAFTYVTKPGMFAPEQYLVFRDISLPSQPVVQEISYKQYINPYKVLYEALGTRFYYRLGWNVAGIRSPEELMEFVPNLFPDYSP